MNLSVLERPSNKESKKEDGGWCSLEPIEISNISIFNNPSKRKIITNGRSKISILALEKGGGEECVVAHRNIKFKGSEADIRSLTNFEKSEFLVGFGTGEILRFQIDQQIKLLGSYRHQRQGIEIMADLREGEGLFVAGSSENTCVVWKKNENGKCQKEFSEHLDTVFGLAKSGDNTFLSSSNDGKVIVNDYSVGKVRKKIDAHTSYAFCCDFDFEKEIILSGSADGTFRFWDFRTYKNIFEHEVGKSVFSCKYFRGKNLFMIGCIRGILEVYDLRKSNEQLCSKSIHKSWLNKFLHVEGEDIFYTCSDDGTINEISFEGNFEPIKVFQVGGEKFSSAILGMSMFHLKTETFEKKDEEERIEFLNDELDEESIFTKVNFVRSKLKEEQVKILRIFLSLS